MTRARTYSKDSKLIQIVDAALAEVTRRSGKWLLCREGCTQCCVGVFAINQLDAARLRRGLEELQGRDPERAARVRARARDARARMAEGFPGDVASGVLDASRAEEFEEFANDEVCPVLDPATGSCDLYGARPMTCRVYGPPVRSEEGLGVCELNFVGATDAEIAACEMVVDSDLESEMVLELEASGVCGETIVAFALGR
jgi:Fe-S-cluster containining protein